MSEITPATASHSCDNLAQKQANVSTEDTTRSSQFLKNEPPLTPTEHYASTSKHIMPRMVHNTKSKTVAKLSLSDDNLSQGKATLSSACAAGDSLLLNLKKGLSPSALDTKSKEENALDSAYTSKYPKHYFEDRFHSLMGITIQILHLIIKQIRLADQTETWIRDNITVNYLDSDSISFIRELIEKFNSLSGNVNPESEESFRRYIKENTFDIFFLARHMQVTPIIPVSHSSLISLGLHELKSRFQHMMRLNNAYLLSWSCDMLRWCKLRTRSPSPDDAESACKAMYVDIQTVSDLIKNLIAVRGTTIAPNELQELEDLISAISETASLHNSLYAEVRHIKYIMEDIPQPLKK